MVELKDVVHQILNDEQMDLCINNAQITLKTVVDRHDLHSRDQLEKFNNILMGEVAEQMVLQWLLSNGKQAYSIVDKSSGKPDDGYDLKLKSWDGRSVECSVKSSLSYKMGIDGILKYFKLASTPKELRDINIQVYFWLDLDPSKGSRTTLPSLKNSAIIGWFAKKDLVGFNPYNKESRPAPNKPLIEGRKMESLLDYLL